MAGRAEAVGVRLHGRHADAQRPVPVPDDGGAKGHDFSVKVDVRDDCDMTKVDISVLPQGLSATSRRPPFEWDLTGINGLQTITVTATDRPGKVGTLRST